MYVDSQGGFMSFKAWLRAGTIAILSLTLSTTLAVAQGREHGHENQNRDDDDDRDHGHGHGHGHSYGHQRYDDHDRDQIREWYHSAGPRQARSASSRAGAPISGQWNPAARASEKNAALPARSGARSSASASELLTRRDQRQSGPAQSGEFSDRGRFPL